MRWAQHYIRSIKKRPSTFGRAIISPHVESRVFHVTLRLYGSRTSWIVNLYYNHKGAGNAVAISPHVLCLSNVCEDLSSESRTDRKKLAARVRSFFRAMYRVCQISLLMGPLVITFPVMYLTRKLIPWIRRTWWAYALWSIEKLGPCMIKFMQWASTRRDILAAEVCDMLEPIQWQTKPHSWGKTVESLKTLRHDWSEYLKIDPTSTMLGSGSVAQVYRGQAMLQDAREPTAPPLPREVAVKVIHPDVKRQIDLDLDLMRYAAWVLESTGHLQWWSVQEFVEEFSCIMKGQLDLRREAEALERFRRNFKGQTNISFPEPVQPLVNEFVLVETYVKGVPISQILKDGEYPVKEKKKIARAGLDAFLKMVFLDNFVHGDLHPGNIFVQMGAAGEPHLTFIDAGIVTELTNQDRRNFVDLFYAIATGQGKEAGRLMIERARNHACEDPEGFSQGISRIVEEATGNRLQLGKIRVAFLIQKVLGLCLQYKVKLESNFASILLAIGVLEGVGRSLDPELDILTAATPVILKSHFYQRKNKEG